MTVTRPLDREERLDQIIRLKRCERPDARFWAAFEQGLRSKQLSTLVIYQPWYLRLGRTALLISRKAAPTTAAAGALAIAVVAITQSSYFARDSAPPRPAIAAPAPQPEPARFAVAATESAIELAGPASTLSQTVEPPSVYRVPVMARPASSANYELQSAPKTLRTRSNSREESEADESAGAKVISASRDF